MEENVSPKIIAAITSAVSAYRQEQKALQEKERPVRIPLQTERVNLWAMAGRQDVVFQRRLWQMKMY
jgi:hypothetical protein